MTLWTAHNMMPELVCLEGQSLARIVFWHSSSIPEGPNTTLVTCNKNYSKDFGFSRIYSRDFPNEIDFYLQNKLVKNFFLFYCLIQDNKNYEINIYKILFHKRAQLEAKMDKIFI